MIDEIARGLREGAYMFWETLWPLVLGFGLSGAVQSFVSRDTMRSKLGDHRPAAIARATGYGIASSSCSYAATAMAKSMFVKGADFVASCVFMFASTNLVLELGVVLVVLMGWQFAASEAIGGLIMVVLLAVIGGFWLRGKDISEARSRLIEVGPTQRDLVGDIAGDDHPGEPWAQSLRRKGRWADAATYAVADLTMLRRELLIGYTVAGFMAVVVPTSVWNVLFLHGHGDWTTVENVMLGPAIAMVSFVCSIGNIPLAAALWKGGISFGGVVSFIFADLVTFPLLMVYRRYYGTKLTLKMVAVFWAVMSAAGLATEVIFRSAGAIPAVHVARIAPSRISWNYTTYLDIAALMLFGLMYWVYRNRERLGGGSGHAIDPVCKMQVEISTAPASCLHDAQRVYFCCDGCRSRFEAEILS